MNHDLRSASDWGVRVPRVTRFCRSGTPARHNRPTGKSARPTDQFERHGPHVTTSFRLCFLLVTALATQAPAQTILIDDFNDGNVDGWTTFDSTVGRRGPFRYGPGIFDASSGAYHLETTGIVPVGAPGNGRLWSTWDQSSDPTFSNGFVRAKVRVETDETIVSLALRGSGTKAAFDTSYLFEAFPGRCPRSSADGCFVVEKLQAGRGTRLVQLRDPNLTFGVNEW